MARVDGLNSSPFGIFFLLCLISALLGENVLARPPISWQNVLNSLLAPSPSPSSSPQLTSCASRVPERERDDSSIFPSLDRSVSVSGEEEEIVCSSTAELSDEKEKEEEEEEEEDKQSGDSILDTLENLIYALDVMQNNYFELWQGTWPTSIDWTAAVLGTHVSATLSTLSSTSKEVLSFVGGHYSSSSSSSSSTLNGANDDADTVATARAKYENLVNRFFSHVSSFYFGENAFSLRNEAFDDMLWVVLGWLENIKLQELHSGLHYSTLPAGDNNVSGQTWHGTQFRVPAAHRARLFYDLASAGWDKSLCHGGMVWNPYLLPYKNAITNELFITASVAMYLYFPGDVIDSPFVESSLSSSSSSALNNPQHLKAAVEGYRWLKSSKMTGINGLYADGFHVRGWRSRREPGTGECDELNPMVYSYNQGVILSGLSGLWIATGSAKYLDDAHDLVRRVIEATGWINSSSPSSDGYTQSQGQWAGLGRDGIMEDTCDSYGTCNNDGQTFKGIFFHHLAELCRPLRHEEEQFLETNTSNHDKWQQTYSNHRAQCRTYGEWIEHNAKAALTTRDAQGKFGMWWGRPYREDEEDNSIRFIVNSSVIPEMAVDYRNTYFDDEVYGSRKSTLSSSPSSPSSRKLIWNRDYNDRGHGRTVETQGGGLAVLRALYQWKTLGDVMMV